MHLLEVLTEPRTYFVPALVGYVIGMIITLAMLVVLKVGRRSLAQRGMLLLCASSR